MFLESLLEQLRILWWWGAVLQEGGMWFELGINIRMLFLPEPNHMGPERGVALSTSTQ